MRFLEIKLDRGIWLAGAQEVGPEAGFGTRRVKGADCGGRPAPRAPGAVHALGRFGGNPARGPACKCEWQSGDRKRQGALDCDPAVQGGRSSISPWWPFDRQRCAGPGRAGKRLVRAGPTWGRRGRGNVAGPRTQKEVARVCAVRGGEGRRLREAARMFRVQICAVLRERVPNQALASPQAGLQGGPGSAGLRVGSLPRSELRA